MSIVSGPMQAIMGKDAADAQVAGADRASELQYKLGQKAIAAQTDAVNKAIAAEREMFDISRADLAPWRSVGTNALTKLQDKVAAGPPEFKFEETPGYQFRLKEGINALERGAAARGKVLSGGQQKALVRFGQDYATGEYRTEEDRSIGRYYQELNPLFSLAGLGQMGTNLGANAATTTGANMGNALISGGTNQANILNTLGTNVGNNALYSGTARASGYINQANALKGASNTAMTGLALYKALSAANTASKIPYIAAL